MKIGQILYKHKTLDLKQANLPEDLLNAKSKNSCYYSHHYTICSYYALRFIIRWSVDKTGLHPECDRKGILVGTGLL